MREFKILAQIDIDGRILNMEPIKKATGRPGDIVTMVCRVYTEDEIDRETSQLMQDNTHTYYKKCGRTHQKS